MIEFSIKRLMDGEITRITERLTGYDPDDIQSVADDLRKYADRYEAVANLALKADAK